MPELLLEYVRGTYERGSTRLMNAVIDWVLVNMDPKIGYKYVDQLLSYLAFADDLVLFAETEWGLKRQIKLVVESLAKCDA